MRLAPVPPRARTSRPRLRPQPIEWLESRLLLDSGLSTVVRTTSNDLAIVSVDPAPGSRLTTAPAAVTFRFDRAIDPFSVGSDNDFDLLQLGPDGTFTSVYYNVNPAPSESLDSSGKTLTLSLNRQLGAGHYEVVLRRTSALAGKDGTLLSTAGMDQQITDFTIAPAGQTTASATSLGTIGQVVTTVAGSLDLTANPAAVSLYKITLPAGHFWRLGLEVTAQRDGGSLDSALALFDASGHAIATDDLGRPDDPLDPYLFAGVPAGTYYVGVSGAGNLPGATGGYDLLSGSPGSVSQNQAGGAFHLNVVADPADAPASLLGFAVDHADPTSAAPTGFTVQFSQPIHLVGTVGTLGDLLAQGIAVVDAAGRSWPLVASRYQEDQAEVSYLFENALPAGSYTVEIPAQGGLTDLAGLTPVAPGEPSGVLATFRAPAGINTGQNSHDIGPLYPALAHQGVMLASTLRPGQSQTFRFVVEFPGIYTFQSTYAGGALAIVRTGPGGLATIDAGLPGVTNGTNDAPLGPGVYQVTLSATGVQPVIAQLTLRAPSISLESIIENGLGQGPALSLRLVSPTQLGLSSTTTLSAVPLPSAAGDSSINTASTAASTSTPMPPGLFVSLGGSLVGRPATEPVTAASSTPSQDVAASTASSSIVLVQGSGPSFGMQALSFFRPRTPLRISLREAQPPVGAPALSPAALGAEAPALPAAAPWSLPRPGWLNRIRPVLANWLKAREPEVLPAPVAQRTVRLVDSTGVPAESRTEAAASRVIPLAPPVGIVLGAGVLLHYRRAIYRWISTRRRRAGGWQVTGVQQVS